jgi:hypothetical protein
MLHLPAGMHTKLCNWRLLLLLLLNTAAAAARLCQAINAPIGAAHPEDSPAACAMLLPLALLHETTRGQLSAAGGAKACLTAWLAAAALQPTLVLLLLVAPVSMLHARHLNNFAAQ